VLGGTGIHLLVLLFLRHFFGFEMTSDAGSANVILHRPSNVK
jgi:hypothetical protein